MIVFFHADASCAELPGGSFACIPNEDLSENSTLCNGKYVIHMCRYSLHFRHA